MSTSRPDSTGSPRLKPSPLAWVLALLPIAIVTVIALRGTAYLRDPTTLNLRGEWQYQVEGTGEQSSVVQPGDLGAQGRGVEVSWLRRRFDLPAHLQDRDLFFILGDARSGVAELFINGTPLGTTSMGPHPLKPEHVGPEGFFIPSGLAKGTNNELALRVVWHTAGQKGLRAELLLGAAQSLGPAFRLAAETRRNSYAASLGVLLFAASLVGALMVVEWQSNTKGIYVATLLLLISAVSYVLTLTSNLFTVPNLWAGAYPPVLVLSYAHALFVGRYLHGPRSKLARVSGIVLIGCGVVYTTAISIAPPALALVVFGGLLPAVVLATCLYLIGVALRLLAKPRSALDPVLASALLCMTGTAFFDAVKDAGVASGPRLFLMVVPVSALMAAVLVLADFTRVAASNRVLTLSLRETNVELRTALTRAEESSRLKSEFVATVSHELRTPLNAIINVPEGLLEGFEQLPTVRCEACSKAFSLEPGESPPSTCPACQAQGRLVEQPRWRYRGDLGTIASNLDRIHRSGRNLLALINDLLDFSRLEGKDTQVVRRALDLRQVLHGAAGTLEGLAQRSGIRIRLELPAEEASLEGDLVKLSQIFVNLLGNALKFSPRDSEVVVRLAPSEWGWRASVIDPGIGIAPEHHETIFDSFRQVDGGETRKFGGTGLGLAITKRLVELHGGRIWVESALGRGSTFHVDLPRQAAL